MSSGIAQETIDAINAALPDELTCSEVVSLVMCIMLSYGFTKEMIAKAADAMTTVVVDFTQEEEEEDEGSCVDSTAPEA